MRIRIWGCRGSLPTPGPTTLRYGGNSTCVEVRSSRGTLVVVDAGSGMRLLGKEILRRKSDPSIVMLLTHSHWDHLMGFPFFVPAYFSQYTIHVGGGTSAGLTLKNYLARQMEPPYFPVDFSVMKAKFVFDTDETDSPPAGFSAVTSIPLNHPSGGSGYRFAENGKTFVFLTDNEISYAHPEGLTRDAYVEFCRGTDLLFHDAQYTDAEYQRTRGWGHSTYRDATALAIEAGVKRLGLFHHDPDRTDDDLDVQVERCRQQIYAAGSKVECFAAAEGTVVDL